eukprot:5811593-Prymnesium_polylepis.2
MEVAQRNAHAVRREGWQRIGRTPEHGIAAADASPVCAGRVELEREADAIRNLAERRASGDGRDAVAGSSDARPCGVADGLVDVGRSDDAHKGGQRVRRWECERPSHSTQPSVLRWRPDRTAKRTRIARA